MKTMIVDHLAGMGQAVRRLWGATSPRDLFVVTAASVALILLLSAYAALPELTVFGHDEVHYYRDFGFKLREDGRWLNFLLHDFLRSIPPSTWALLFLGSCWLLFFRLARSMDFDVGYAVLVATTILLAPPFVEQSIWPATTITAVILTLLASTLMGRGLSYPVIYVLSGILLFGTMQSFYFLLPLFFLHQFAACPQGGARRWPLLLAHMGWWIVGAVAGVLVMSCILWQVTGHFGVQPAAWRRIQPVHDLAGLLRNIFYVVDAFWFHLTKLLEIAGANRGWFVATLGLAMLVRIRTLLFNYHALAILASVMLAFFVFSIPLAPCIGSRSLVAMAAAFVLFVALVPGSSAAGQALGALLLVTISHGFSTYGESYLARHKSETTFFCEKLRELIPGHPSGYAAIALFGEMGNDAPEAFIFNKPSRMHAIVYAIGAREYRDCRLANRCDDLVPGKPVAVLPFARRKLQFSVDNNHVGMIRYQSNEQSMSECSRTQNAKRDFPVPLSPCAWRQPSCPGRPAPGPPLRHTAPPP